MARKYNRITVPQSKERIRKSIDLCDKAIANEFSRVYNGENNSLDSLYDLLVTRFGYSLEMGKLKAKSKSPVLDKSREQEVIGNYARILIENGINESGLAEKLATTIMAESRDVQYQLRNGHSLSSSISS